MGKYGIDNGGPWSKATDPGYKDEIFWKKEAVELGLPPDTEPHIIGTTRDQKRKVERDTERIQLGIPVDYDDGENRLLNKCRHISQLRDEAAEAGIDMTDILIPGLTACDLATIINDINVVDTVFRTREKIKALIENGYLPDRPITSFTQEEIDAAGAKASEAYLENHPEMRERLKNL